MLRFSRSSRSLLLQLQVRKKHHRFSRELWKGLFIAIAVHGIFFLVLKIASPPPICESPLLPFVAVEIEEVPPVILQPVHSRLSLAPMNVGVPTILAELPVLEWKEFDIDLSIKEPDFSSLENVSYIPFIEEEEIR